MQTSKKTFSKQEKLCSLKDIETLFKKGKSIFIFPLKVIFISKNKKQTQKQSALIEENVTEPNLTKTTLQKEILTPRVLISVSKRNFKKAVDRNRLKRQIREGYRLQKNEFNLSHIATFAFICVAKEHVESKFLHKRIKKLMEMLEKEK